MPHIPPGTKRVYLYIPPRLAERLETFLRSEALNRVPQGSWNAFFLQRAEEFFATRRMPLGSHEGYGPMDWIVGPEATIARVAHDLAGKRHAPDGMDEAFPELTPGRADGGTAHDVPMGGDGDPGMGG